MAVLDTPRLKKEYEMSIFDKRTAFKPFEYPETIEYKNAINHSYWLVSEWNFLSDIHDFNVKLDETERNAIKNALLAISQIEVSVKKFWTKLGERFPKSEFEQVGVTFGECFVDGTEILTPNGWVDLKDVKVGDEVIQYHENNTLSVTKVKHKTDKHYSGEMYRFYKKTTTTVVTPNHRMICYDQNDKLREIYAEDLSIKNSNLKLPEAAKLVGGRQTELSFMDRLRIAIQADGYGKKTRKGNGFGAEYEVRIQKPRKIERLDWILSKIKGVDFTKNPVPSREGMYCYTIRIDDVYDYKTFDWVNLNDKSHLWCLDFVEELAEWDGSRYPHKKDCKIKFTSTNESVADKAQMIGVAAGYRTNKILHKDFRKESYKDTHIISFTKNREKVTLPPLKKEIFDYSGIVRCVTVDSGMIVTRYHGKTFISGNSEVRHADAYSHLLEVLGLNDDFSQLLQNPVIQGRVEYLTKYLKGASDNNNENFTLTLALFSVFIENVSLFSQFLIIKSFNKYKNILKDVDNVVQATQKEELVHAMFGVFCIKQIQKEFPDWFNDDFFAKLYRACKKAHEAECAIIDWIFERGELSFLSKDVVKEFIKQRFNESLEMIGGKKVFEIDDKKIAEIKWFNDEIYAEVNTDFFYKKPVSYAKKTKAINAEDIF